MMIVFAIVLSFSISLIDYLRLKEKAIKNNEFQSMNYKVDKPTIGASPTTVWCPNRYYR